MADIVATFERTNLVYSLTLRRHVGARFALMPPQPCRASGFRFKSAPSGTYLIWGAPSASAIKVSPLPYARPSAAISGEVTSEYSPAFMGSLQNPNA